MLRSLSIENIAVIEKCNIDFSEGFNVLTGETGAGKSIVIDSINAVTGQRTSRELIRTGCDKASVSAVFDGIGKEAEALISEYGIAADDGSIMILRTLNSDGKTVCRINGTAVNTAVLKEVGALLINIHGQHDNQALLDPANHCSFIDRYGKCEDALDGYRTCYERFKAVRKTLKKLRSDEDERKRRSELLRFQVNEIETAKLNIGELDELLRKRELMRNSEKVRAILADARFLLSGDDNTPGTVTAVSGAAGEMLHCKELVDGADKLYDRLLAAVTELSDISDELRRREENVSFDENELNECEQRIELIESLLSKYGGTEEAALGYLAEASDELMKADGSDEEAERLEAESERLEDELVKLGDILSDKRKKSAADFSKRVCGVLKFLEMPNVIFLVNIEKKMYTADGCDDISFLISANAGQEPKSLAKTASGGELSRVMLAIKSVLSDADSVETLIFDEIDTGISGRAAEKVGRQLKSLSKAKQVICVTHLAQIAASGENHLLISKSTDNKNTYTKVSPVDGEERIKEIARIISGAELTENVYSAAAELIENHK